MQELRKFHLRHRSKFNQLILLDEKAFIVTSCDSIFEPPVLNRPVTTWFPFMESIYPNIWESLSSQSTINFNKIQTPISELPGIYDFTFSKVTIDQKELVLWVIYDYTDLYEDFKQFQQRKNELEIHRETLERRHLALKSIDEIKIQQNIIIESLDHLQLTYFNKIKAALLAPVNALDGITMLLAGALEQKDQKYTQQLRVVLKQLSLILDELENVETNATLDFNHHSFHLTSLFSEVKDLIQRKNNSPKVALQLDPQIPSSIKGNDLYLKQILFGIIGNAVNLHPNSSFEIKIAQTQKIKDRLNLEFQVIEYLGTKTSFLSESDHTNMIYQLSIIKQLIDLQKGAIYVDRNPKDLSITITFHLDFTIP